jgi:hypothetical protein
MPQAPAWSAAWGEKAAVGPALVEGGPQKSFPVLFHPTLTVSIGYADLTILTHSGSTIDVSVSKSDGFGPMRSTEPISASSSGESVHITKPADPGFSMGDDRLVTVVVPPSTQVTILDAGDIRVSGLRAEAAISSVGSGSVTVDDYNAPALRVTTPNGLIALHQVTVNHIDVASRNDRIDATSLSVRDGTIEADDTVTLGFAPGTNTTLTAQTSDGAIHLTGFPDASAPTKNSDGDDDSAVQTVRVGNGAGRVDVHSNSGNINLNQGT